MMRERHRGPYARANVREPVGLREASRGLTAARAELARHGMTIKKTDWGDYRVTFKGERDPDAGYYTDDLDDAVRTGISISTSAHPGHAQESRAMGIPDLVTGALSPNARLSSSGTHRGVTYEIYYDETAERPTRPSRHGGTIGARGWGRGRNYAAVVYSPYESEKHGHGEEAEQISYETSPMAAGRKAMEYIDKLLSHVNERSLGRRRS